jgi:hypothetical protein
VTRKPWLANEVDYVLANRTRLKLGAIAGRLGRSTASVVGMLVYYGHSRKKESRAEWECRLRKMHAAGRSDREIAGRMGVSRGTVQRRRAALGLPPAEWCGWRQRYRRQMRKAESRSLADLRWRRVRVAELLAGTAPGGR